MKIGVTIGVVALVLVVLVVGFFLLTNNKTPSNENNSVQKENVDNNKMVDCGKASDPGCFMNRMNGCLPVTAKMIASDGSTEIDITILGIENETCHFERKINGVVDLNCYFPKGTMNWDVIDQTFGNDKGLQKVVDDNCKMGGW